MRHPALGIETELDNDLGIIRRMTNGKDRNLTTTFWPLPRDLKVLHDAILEYSRDIQNRAAAEHERTHEGPISYGALFTLHRTAIITMRSIRSVCETGWTPTSPILIRTLLDILASCYAIVAKPEDAEYMAFKFLGSFLIRAINDADTSDELRKHDIEQLDGLRQQASQKDCKRVDDFIAAFKPQPYWYRPEYVSPGTIFKDKIPLLFDIYRQFSGSTHGSFIGSLLFTDSPDAVSINPEEHPLRTRAAIVGSCRVLLDISGVRGIFENVTNIDEYRRIVRTFILPQRDKTVAK